MSEFDFQINEEYDFYVCTNCLNKFYGFPKYELVINNPKHPLDFKHFSLCSKKCLLKVIKNEE